MVSRKISATEAGLPYFEVLEPEKSPIVLGLRENAGLFGILVIMSAFVGAMVGFERSLLPELTKSWSVSETEAALLMVAVFGLSKAIANLFTGKLIAEY